MTIPDEHPATRRDVALECTRKHPRDLSSWAPGHHFALQWGLLYKQKRDFARARGQHAEALKQLDAAIRRDPAYPIAQVARRDVRHAIKRAKRARRGVAAASRR